MPTEITLTRKARASKLDQLLKDDGLWKVAHELEAYLQTQDLRRLTASDVAAFLKPRYSDATLIMAGVEYIQVFDPVQHRWMTICYYDGKISIPDGVEADTIVVGFKVSASYA